MSTQDGGPAFPSSVIDEVFVEEFGRWDKRLGPSTGGMSLRDYFAAAALPSVIAAYLAANGNGCAADHAVQNAPALAYRYADAMIRERAK